ncbi:MAG: hypothetical protein ACTS4U_00500 [Candidatus Hodgkinia cicadicola]
MEIVYDFNYEKRESHSFECVYYAKSGYSEGQMSTERWRTNWRRIPCVNVVVSMLRVYHCEQSLRNNLTWNEVNF